MGGGKKSLQSGKKKRGTFKLGENGIGYLNYLVTMLTGRCFLCQEDQETRMLGGGVAEGKSGYQLIRSQWLNKDVNPGGRRRWINL